MERYGRVGDFFKGIRYLMLNPKGDAAKAAERARAPDRVVDFVKAAIIPGTTLAGQWGAELATFENLPQAFLSSVCKALRFSIRFLKDMLVVPPRTKVVVMASVLTSNPIAGSTRQADDCIQSECFRSCDEQGGTLVCCYRRTSEDGRASALDGRAART